MPIDTIHSEAEYRSTLLEIEQYFDREPPRGTPEAARFQRLADLIEAYEAENYPIAAPERPA